MADLDLTELIEKRIRSAFSGRRFNRKVRQAELLMRNPLFLRALDQTKEEAKREIESIDRQIRDAQDLLAPRHPDVYKRDPLPEEITKEDKEAFQDALSPALVWLRAMRKRLLKENDFNWQFFCAGWGIERTWGGALNNLFNYAVGIDAINFQCRDGRCGFLPLGEPKGPLRYWISKKIPATELLQMRPDPEATLKAGLPPTHGPEPSIEIVIRPSTKRNEILGVWSRIEKLKKEVWGFSEGDGRTFRRDLCFWDLRHDPEYGHRPCQRIADLWNRFWPKDRVNRTKVDQGARRIQDFIDRISEEVPESFERYF